MIEEIKHRNVIFGAQFIVGRNYDSPEAVYVYDTKGEKVSRFDIDRSSFELISYIEKEKQLVYRDTQDEKIYCIKIDKEKNQNSKSIQVDNEKWKYTKNNDLIAGSDNLYTLKVESENPHYQILKLLPTESGYSPDMTDWSDHPGVAISADERFLTVVQNGKRYVKDTSTQIGWTELEGLNSYNCQFLEDHILAIFIDDKIVYYDCNEKSIKSRFYFQAYDQNMKAYQVDESVLLFDKGVSYDIYIYRGDYSKYELLKTNFFPISYGNWIVDFRVYGNKVYVKHAGGEVRAYKY